MEKIATSLGNGATGFQWPSERKAKPQPPALAASWLELPLAPQAGKVESIGL